MTKRLGWLVVVAICFLGVAWLWNAEPYGYWGSFLILVLSIVAFVALGMMSDVDHYSESQHKPEGWLSEE